MESIIKLVAILDIMAESEKVMEKMDKEQFREIIRRNIVVSDEFDQLIDMQPTVDVKQIVRAYWIEGKTDNPNIHNILCSHCFEGYPSKGHANSQYTKKRFKWCPSCGAKMESEE